MAIKKRQKRKAIIDRLTVYLTARSEIRFAILFGSWARGDANTLSDIDVAVYVDTERMHGPYPYGYKAEVLADLLKVLQTNTVDLVILNTAPPLLQTEVIDMGITLVCRDNMEYEQFRAHAHEAYEATHVCLKEQEAALVQRFEAGTFGKP